MEAQQVELAGYPTPDISDPNFMLDKDAYSIGESVYITMSCLYKGYTQNGQIVIRIGDLILGIMKPVWIAPPLPITLQSSEDWISQSWGAGFGCPEGLRLGHTYDMDVTITADSSTKETKTRASVLRVIDPEETETLRVNITPVGRGYVVTDPASVEGKTEWHDEETGEFLYGTNVRVTAVPYTGYKFEKWSSEIVGGVSYQNPEYVQSMTEHRAVKAHFIGEGEPIDGLYISGLTVVDYYKKV